MNETTTPVAQAVATALRDEHERATLAAWRRSPCHANRASSVGHPCEAYLYFERVAWDQAAPPEYELLQRFRIGSESERHILDQLCLAAETCGLEVLEQQTALEDKTLRLTGHIDSLLRARSGNKIGVEPGRKVVVEVKTLSQFLDVETIEDLRALPFFGARWYGQMQAYLYLRGIEDGLFLIQRLSGELRWLPVAIDYTYADALIRKIERVNAAVESGQVPARLSRPAVCRRCPHLATCCPPLEYGPGAEFADEAELVKALGERETLAARVAAAKVALKEYEKIDRACKDTLKAAAAKRKTDQLIVGDWQVTVSRSERISYTVAAATVEKVEIERVTKCEP